jgi:hypothetical protein
MAYVRYFVTPVEGAWHVTLDGVSMAQCPSVGTAVSRAIAMANLMGKMGHESDVMLAIPEKPLALIWTHGVDEYPLRAVA